MRNGLRCGSDDPLGCTRNEASPMSFFLRDDGGYTTIAVALVILLSLALTFSLATSQWMMARSSDVQHIADIAALSGENVVSSYSTVARVLDACVLSMGILGVLLLGAGLIVCCVPGAGELGTRVIDAARKVLEARKDFARSCLEGLRTMESALPGLIALNAASAVRANSSESVSYVGTAIAYPLESESDFSSLETPVETEGLEDAAEDLQEATDRAEDAAARASAALEMAWRADCVDDPSCLRQRAASLAGMGGVSNPDYSSYELWNFGVAITRSRTYYSERISQESVEGSGDESLTDSMSRLAFYEYAQAEMAAAWYREDADGQVSMSLPDLPRNTAEMKETSLYTEVRWPCTYEREGRTLHSSLACSGVSGSYAGDAALCDLDGGYVRFCESCRMNAGDVGRVAAISTTATNGYEHYWKIIVEAADEFQEAKNEEAEARGEMEDLAEEGLRLFEEALDQLSVPTAKLCPPGAWGCIGVVVRSGVGSPSELISTFSPGVELPAGAAISAATLAPDPDTEEGNVLASFFDGITSGDSLSAGGVLGSITSCWGSLLISYGSPYETISEASDSLFDSVDGVLGGSVGSWLKRKLKDAVRRTGFAPTDLRLRKPVLVNSQQVTDKAGETGPIKVRELVQTLPGCRTVGDVVAAVGASINTDESDDEIVVARLPIPGTDISIPLSVDLSRLGSS